MSIEQLIIPVTHNLGAFEVRRALPSPQRTMVGPFIFVDQFGPAHLPPGQAMDVRPHPHINRATVTWLFERAIDHRDSIGSFATIRPGRVNLMTTGRGKTGPPGGLRRCRATTRSSSPFRPRRRPSAIPDISSPETTRGPSRLLFRHFLALLAARP